MYFSFAKPGDKSYLKQEKLPVALLAVVQIN
jgi:hypothetical protein